MVRSNKLFLASASLTVYEYAYREWLMTTIN